VPSLDAREPTFDSQTDTEGNFYVVVYDGRVEGWFAMLPGMSNANVNAVLRDERLPRALRQWLHGHRMGLRRQGITAGIAASLWMEIEHGTTDAPLLDDLMSRFVASIFKAHVRYKPSEDSEEGGGRE